MSAYHLTYARVFELLDEQLVNDLGGVSKVAEMTGRKGRMIKKEDGEIVYEKRTHANGISMTMQASFFWGVGWLGMGGVGRTTDQIQMLYVCVCSFTIIGSTAKYRAGAFKCTWVYLGVVIRAKRHDTTPYRANRLFHRTKPWKDVHIISSGMCWYMFVVVLLLFLSLFTNIVMLVCFLPLFFFLFRRWVFLSMFWFFLFFSFWFFPFRYWLVYNFLNQSSSDMI